METEGLFGVSDGILDITRRSGMVRRIRFIYWKVLELIRKSSGIFGNVRKVLEGKVRKVRKVPELGGTHHGRPRQGGAPPTASQFELAREVSFLVGEGSYLEGILIFGRSFQLREILIGESLH
jgi:hypothetical protein